MNARYLLENMSTDEKLRIRAMYNFINEQSNNSREWYNSSGELKTGKIEGGGQFADVIFKNKPEGGYPKKIQMVNGQPVLDATTKLPKEIETPPPSAAGTPASAPGTPAPTAGNQQTYKQPQGYVNMNDTDPSVITSGQKIIGKGARGPLVKWVQQKLAYNYNDVEGKIGGVGCKDDSSKCDGIFGINSITFATKYQNDKNIPGKKNGVVGKLTWAELDKIGQ